MACHPWQVFWAGPQPGTFQAQGLQVNYFCRQVVAHAEGFQHLVAEDVYDPESTSERWGLS